MQTPKMQLSLSKDNYGSDLKKQILELKYDTTLMADSSNSYLTFKSWEIFSILAFPAQTSISLATNQKIYDTN